MASCSSNVLVLRIVAFNCIVFIGYYRSSNVFIGNSVFFPERQSEHMINKHHVYMLRSGRISMCGLTPGNVDYVAQAIHETVTNVKDAKL